MPKKKTQHKKQNKVPGTDESFKEEDIKIKENEEYETVVDYEESGKFSKRRLASNWAKYDAPLSSTEFDVEDEETTGIYDYNFLVENASSDFSHFEFTFEKSRKETKPIINNNIFKLDLNLLSSGLACIPFYERIGLDEKISDEDKKRCDEEAKRSWEKYQIIRENFNRNNMEENKIKKSGEEKNIKYPSVSSHFKKDISDFNFFPQNNFQTSEVSKTSPKVENATDAKSIEKFEEKKENMDWLDKALLLNNEDNLLGEKNEAKKEQKKTNEGIAEQEQKDETQPWSKTKIFSDTGENLEDWLDSVLDD